MTDKRHCRGRNYKSYRKARTPPPLPDSKSSLVNILTPIDVKWYYVCEVTVPLKFPKMFGPVATLGFVFGTSLYGLGVGYILYRPRPILTGFRNTVLFDDFIIKSLVAQSPVTIISYRQKKYVYIYFNKIIKHLQRRRWRR